MLTFQQLMRSSLDNPEARRAVSLISGVSERDLRMRGGAVFNEQKDAISRTINELGQSGLGTYANQYQSWGDTSPSGAEAKTKALEQLSQYEKTYRNAGVDPSSVEPLQKYYSMFGERAADAGTVAGLRELNQELQPAGSQAGSSQAGGPQQTNAQTFDMVNFSDYPAELKNSLIWQNATDYDKTILYSTFKARQVQDPQKQQQMLEALGNAMSSLDPYYRQKTRLATDEIERSIGKLTGDYQSNLKSNEDRIKQLKEDLIFNKDQLTIEQQQEMSDQLRNYQTQLYNTQQQMAESGLAFSSPRATAEANLASEQQGISQSTARKYARAFREQDLNAKRQAAALEQNLADLERGKKEGLTDISRRGEEALGSANMPATGVSQLGGIQGTLEAEKQAQALQYGKTITNYFNPNI